MRETILVINGMVEKGVMTGYAIGGAVAALNYLEPTATEDLDILVSFDEVPDRPRSGLVTLEPIFAHLKMLGYTEFRKEGIVIEGWPVQFLPVANDLDAEALERAQEVEIGLTGGSVRARILRAEHVVATALRVGRAKDYIRIADFIEQGAVELRALAAVLDRHGMRDGWRRFCMKTGTADPLANIG
jgi:hypothetical protein